MQPSSRLDLSCISFIRSTSSSRFPSSQPTRPITSSIRTPPRSLDGPYSLRRSSRGTNLRPMRASPAAWMPSVRRLAALIASVAVFAGVAAAADPADAGAATVWLCKPGLANNPCAPGLGTTLYANNGAVEGIYTPKTQRKPRIDCFYVYPTVSDDKTDNSDLSIDPEERSVALYQAARYSGQCRIFAPMYQQVTITRLLQGLTTITPEMQATAYASALSGWQEYLKKFNHGRPFVLIGHSQGTFVLRQLIAQQIDPKKKLRDRLVSAILLGGNVLVNAGSNRGGDFKNVGGCRSQRQTGCVVAFSSFNAPVPQNSLFGRTMVPGKQVLCSYPGSPSLRSVVPTQPFAPGTTLGVATPAVGFPQPAASTPWVEYDHGYQGACSGADNANVLQISPNAGAPVLHP